MSLIGYMCKQNGETVDHLLLRCEVARVLWDDIFSRIELAWVQPRRVMNLLACWRGLQGNPQIASVQKMIPMSYGVHLDGKL